MIDKYALWLLRNDFLAAFHEKRYKDAIAAAQHARVAAKELSDLTAEYESLMIEAWSFLMGKEYDAALGVTATLISMVENSGDELEVDSEEKIKAYFLFGWVAVETTVSLDDIRQVLDTGKVLARVIAPNQVVRFDHYWSHILNRRRAFADAVPFAERALAQRRVSSGTL